MCQGYFQETHGTLLHGQRVAAELIVCVVAALAEGLGIRAVARVFAVDPNTVLQWLVEAADHLQAFSHYLLHDLRVSQVQLDELFAVLSAVKAGQVSDAEALECLEPSPHWVWAAIDPESKLLLDLDVGERTLAMAQRVVHQIVQVPVPGCVPLFLTDGLKEYVTALLEHFGHWVQPARQQAKGPLPKPRWMPQPALRYAQVVKTYRRRCLVRVSHRIVFGTLAGATPEDCGGPWAYLPLVDQQHPPMAAMVVVATALKRRPEADDPPAFGRGLGTRRPSGKPASSSIPLASCSPTTLPARRSIPRCAPRLRRRRAALKSTLHVVITRADGQPETREMASLERQELTPTTLA
jgi:hypothetical protein